MTLLRTVELYLEISGMPPSRFGREALGDPGLVGDLRRGRSLRPATQRRLRDFLARMGEQA